MKIYFDTEKKAYGYDPTKDGVQVVACIDDEVWAVYAGLPSPEWWDIDANGQFVQNVPPETVKAYRADIKRLTELAGELDALRGPFEAHMDGFLTDAEYKPFRDQRNLLRTQMGVIRDKWGIKQ